MADANIDLIRQLASNSLSKGLLTSAIVFGQDLAGRNNCSAGDKLFLARCYFQNNEYRRCLSCLEQAQFLSASAIKLAHVNIRFGFISGVPSQDVRIGVEALLLAGQCLVACEQLDDCLTLLESFMLTEENDDVFSSVMQNAQALYAGSPAEINPVAGIFALVGRCYDAMDNRSRCSRAYEYAVRVDPGCMEAAEMLIADGFLNASEKQLLFSKLHFDESRLHLQQYYKDGLFVLPMDSQNAQLQTRSFTSLVRQAEILMETNMEEAYRVIRQAYAADPFDTHCLLVYINNLMELGLKTELYYLGHELVNSMPKSTLSWFTVGCYYYTCRKYEFAQSYFQKCIRVDKRFARGYVLLGCVLSAQEESEQAISAFRTASRLLPGDHRPLVLLAKELVRTNYESLALHFLEGCVRINSRDDPVVLNELGLVYYRLKRYEEAKKWLGVAAESIAASNQHCAQIFCNYATVLRKTRHFAESLQWYEASISGAPNDPNAVASKAFTLHMMRRFADAITAYHRALSLNPSSTFCGEMLTRAMEDMNTYGDCDSGR